MFTPKQRSDWRLAPYIATFEIKGLSPTRERTILLPALCEEDAQHSIIRFSALIGWEVTITKRPQQLPKGLYEASFYCPHEVDYDLWSPLHYDNLAWRADGKSVKLAPDAPKDGRGAHCIIV